MVVTRARSARRSVPTLFITEFIFVAQHEFRPSTQKSRNSRGVPALIKLFDFPKDQPPIWKREKRRTRMFSPSLAMFSLIMSPTV